MSQKSTDRTERSNRRRELLDAVDQVVREQGPDASMSALAAGAGITKPILYRHFGDKEGLYQALAERYVAPLLDTLRSELAKPGDRRERTRRTIEGYLAFVEEHRQEYRFLMDRVVVEGRQAHSTVSAFVRRIASEVAAALAVVLGEDEPSGATLAWSHALVGMVHLAGDWWIDERPMARGELVEHLMALLWEGLGGIDDWLSGRTSQALPSSRVARS